MVEGSDKLKETLVMQEFVIMTKDCEKYILAVDDKRHISLFEEIGYRMTGRGFDEEITPLAEKNIRQPVVEWESSSFYELRKRPSFSFWIILLNKPFLKNHLCLML